MYPEYSTTSNPPNYGASGDPWGNWQSYMSQLTPDPSMFPRLQDRARRSGELYYNPAFRNLRRQRQQLGREYEWGRQEIEPEYKRFVEEQRHGLGQQLGAGRLARRTTAQDYDISGRQLGEGFRNTLRRTEQDMARRGLWQSGLLSKQNTMLGQKYITGMGDLGRARSSRMADLNSQMMNARQRQMFNLSDAQRARTDQYRKMLEGYQGKLSDVDWQRQQLSEEQGVRASSRYEDLMDAYQQFALQARQQGLAERQFHHTAHWAQKDSEFEREKFEEDKRRWGEEFALRQQAMRRAGGGGSGGYGRSNRGSAQTGDGTGWFDFSPAARQQEFPNLLEQYRKKQAQAGYQPHWWDVLSAVQPFA